MSECKPCQLVECVPANDFSYSLAVPPPPPPGVPPFGNDAFQFCCPGSETLNITAPVPVWATVSGNCISIIPNTFRGFDKAVVNGQAQALLNSFVAGNTTCGTSAFKNVPASFYLSCTGGIYNGESVCETVNAAVFTSSVSQMDADTHARYAAYVAMILAAPPGPCCAGTGSLGQPIPASLGQGGWSNFSDPTQNVPDGLGRSAAWTWNDTGAVLAFDLEMTANAGRPDSHEKIEIVMAWAYCNPWPTYNFHVHMDYTFNASGIDGTGNGAGAQVVTDDLGTVLPVLDNPAGSGPGSGSWDVFIPVQVGSDNIHIVIDLGNDTTSHAASGSFHGTMTITPLIPPTYVSPTCSVMSVPPVPDNYALRPVNDDFNNATVLTGTSGSFIFDNTYASREPGEPLTIDNFISYRTGWYVWVAPHSGTVTFDPAGSTMADDPAIAVYTGTLITNLISVIEKNQTTPPFTWTAVGGTVYYIRIGGAHDDKGTTHLAWSLV